MDERLRISLWMLGGGGFGGVLGIIFGALAAALYERNGGVAGTRLARTLVENFLKSGDHQPSPTFHAAIIGAADGFFFLGGIGLVAGALVGKSGRPTDELLLPMMAGSLLLVGGAIFFGSMAYALHHRAAQVLSIFASGLLGGLLASKLFGSDFAIGVGAGAVIGVFLCRALNPYSPKFTPSRVGETVSKPRSNPGTDITRSPTTRQNEDFFENGEDKFLV